MSKLTSHQRNEINTQFDIMKEAVQRGFNIIKAIDSSYAFEAIRKLSEPYEREFAKDMELAMVKEHWDMGLLTIAEREEQEERIHSRFERESIVAEDPRRTPMTTK